MDNEFIVEDGILIRYTGNKTTVIIPEGVIKIGRRTFYNKNMTEVIMPDTVTEIGSSAFSHCMNLQTVVFSKSLTVIDSSAFSDCIKLESIELPDTLRSMGSEVFDGCTKLASIKCDSKVFKAVSNPFGSSGRRFADEQGFLIFCGVLFDYYGVNTEIVIPDGVTELYAGLFAGKNIHHVKLPDSLVRIGDFAFSKCLLLESITIPESVKEIGSSVFNNCEHLTSVSIPKTVESMGTKLFVGCRGLADKDGFIIENNTLCAYYGREQEIVIPEGIVMIEDGTFEKAGIRSVTLPSTLKKLGAAFSYCDKLTEIVIPEGVKELKDRTFAGCSKLKTILLPSSLVSIGIGTFQNCTSLEEITIPEGITSIGYSTFNNCSSLVNVNLPDSVRCIERDAFKNCITLKEITIPDTVEEIQDGAFFSCKGLKNVCYQNNQGTVSIHAFDGCPGLADENGLTVIAGVLFKCEDSRERVVVPEGVTCIAQDAFREGYKGMGRNMVRLRPEGTLKSVFLPSSLMEICEGAFAGCTGLKEIVFHGKPEKIGHESFSRCISLPEIILPDSITIIGNKAFAYCQSLKSIRIPKAVGAIGADVFIGCSSLQMIEVDEANRNYASADGMLYNKTGDTLLYVPGMKKMKSFKIPENVRNIGDRAFADCTLLQKIVIPETVTEIGDKVFPRSNWGRNSKLDDIEVSPGAGSKSVGYNVFDIMDDGNPLVYPKLPVTFVKETATQVCLGLGYCMNPDRYEGAYADIYRKYAKSHKKTLLNKAKQQRLNAVEQYFEANPDGKEISAGNKYKPNLSLKKPNELDKVKILEEAVLKGTPEDVKAVLETYKTFEMTARALGYACRYRGLAYVQELINHRATFTYSCSPALQKKYDMCHSTAGGRYDTQYYLMLVPEKLIFHKHYQDGYMYVSYPYTPLCGLSSMSITPELEKETLSLQERIRIAQYLSDHPETGVSMDEMLFWALTHGELEFADALIGMGVDLQKTPPFYYTTYNFSTYMKIISAGSQSLYWNTYVSDLSELNKNQVLPVLERLNALAVSAGKKLIMSQKLFDDIQWNDESLVFALKSMDFTKVNQKKALESAVLGNRAGALEKMADAGWLDQTAKREKLIGFAREKGCHDALIWLMDYKNRTVDVVAENAKEEAKLLRSLNEKPDSVAAMKKIWGYKKLDDGTVVITSYKGNDTEVEIPAIIGKAKVTVIGKDAFSASSYGRAGNIEARKKIVSVTVPDGVVTIERGAFSQCKSLHTVKLPDTLKTIKEVAFRGCNKLKTVLLPAGINSVDESAFYECDSLTDENGFIVINGCLFGYAGKPASVRVPDTVKRIFSISHFGYDPEAEIHEVVLPDGLESIEENAFENFKSLFAVTIPSTVKTIGARAFYYSGLRSIVFKQGLLKIGPEAFAGTYLENVFIPKSVKSIGEEAFCSCCRIRDFSISANTAKIGKHLFGSYDSDDTWSSNRVFGIYVHTPFGSAAEKYMENYSGVHVVNDYPEDEDN